MLTFEFEYVNRLIDLSVLLRVLELLVPSKSLTFLFGSPYFNIRRIYVPLNLSKDEPCHLPWDLVRLSQLIIESSIEGVS